MPSDLTGACEELQREIDKLRAALATASPLDDRLEELERRLRVLAEEVERLRLGGEVPTRSAANGRWRLALAA